MQKQTTAQSTIDDKQWAMICHLGGLAGFLFPLGNVIVPAVVWSMKRDGSELVDQHGKESLNFQLSILLYYFGAGVLCIILIGFLLLFAVFLFQVISIIKATMTADNGQFYRYPMTIRFIQ